MKKVDIFYDILEQSTKQNPDRIAIACNDEEYTYRELQLAVDLFANDLIKMGLQPGDHVALWAMNHVCWPIAYFGIIRAGGVAVLMNYGLPVSEIVAQMRYTDTKYIAYGQNRELMSEKDVLKKVTELLDLTDAQICDIRQDFHGRIEQGEKADALPSVSRDSKKTATIIFTTGSSGVAKAVEQSQYAVCTNFCCAHDLHRDILGMRKLIALPLFHSFGLELMFCYLLHGSSIWLADVLKPDALVKCIVRNQIDDISSVAAVYYGIIQHSDFTREIAERFVYIGLGGSPLSPEELCAIYDVFPNAQLVWGYGQTEACTFVSANRPNDSLEKLTTTVGKKMPCLEVEVLNSQGDCLCVGEIGEIVYRGSSVMNGYYKLPPEEQPFDKNGWLHTGDLGFLDEDGYLHITGRIKDIIIKSGENIMPLEIEAKIMACGGIQTVKVLGVPHPVTGESIEACIIPDPETWNGENELLQQLKGKINSFMMPSHFFVYDQFPLKENGKIDQRVLKEDVIDKLKKLAGTV